MASTSASSPSLIWRIVKWGAATLFALVVVILILPFFVDVEDYKPEIIAAVKEETGRDLVIEGEMSLSVFPNLAVKVGQASFGNASWGKAPVMAKISELRLHLQLLPLLSKQVKLDELVLEKPEIFLEKNNKGQGNWQLPMMSDTEKEKSGTQSDTQSTEENSGDIDAADAAPAGGMDISLKSIRIIDGHVSYQDQKGGVSETISQIQLSVALSSLEDPLSLSGEMVWKDQPIELKSEIDYPKALLTKGVTKISTTIAAQPIDLDISGQVDLARPGVTADMTLKIPSLRELAKWAATALPEDLAPGKLEAFSFAGRLSADPGKIDMNDMTISVDDITAKGNMAVSLAHKVPALKAALSLSDLDVTPYLPQQSGQATAEPKKAANTSGDGGGTNAAKDWDKTEMDLSALKIVDVDFSLKTEKLRYQKILIDSSDLQMILKRGNLTMLLKDMALYQGHGTADIRINASNKPYKIQKKVTVADVQAYDLLRDAANVEKLEGTGNLDIDIQTRGLSQHQFMSNLNGTADFKFLNGAIIGINLGQMVRNVTSAFLAKEEQQKTDFAELSGSTKITNGVARNEDLILKAPLLTVQGKGESNLVQKMVDYRVEPKLVPSIEGQGRSEEMKGLAVPVDVTGHWDNLSYQPDLAAMLSLDPSGIVTGAAAQLDQVKDQVKAVEENVKKLQEAPEKIIPGLLKEQNPLEAILKPKANPEKPAEEAAPQSEKAPQANNPLEDAAGKALNNLFGN